LLCNTWVFEKNHIQDYLKVAWLCGKRFHNVVGRKAFPIYQTLELERIRIVRSTQLQQQKQNAKTS
jgi:hypothetical protein